jgi:predicted glycoside hydrolase/deacetylase ChbG (UPF0249 family)
MGSSCTCDLRTEKSDRRLIVNADDYGQGRGINQGVRRAHEQGIVTSASLMVSWPAAREAAAYAGRHHGLSLGLHLDLGEWNFWEERWQPRYQVVDPEDERAVSAALERQLATFQELAGRPPTHLDSHQHVHRFEPVRSVLAEAGRGLRVPVRGLTPFVVYSGAFYGHTRTGDPLPAAITADALLGLLNSLPPGLTELGCHPGEIDATLGSNYSRERKTELEALCDPRLRLALRDQGIGLASFLDLHDRVLRSI